MKSPDILILSFDPVRFDARLQRQVKYLSREFTVELIALDQLQPGSDSPAGSSSAQPSRIRRGWRGRLLMLLGRLFSRRAYELWYWNSPLNRSGIGTLARQAVALIVSRKPTVIHAHNWITLPAAHAAAALTGAKVVADLREFFPLEHENRWSWRFFRQPLIEYFLRQTLPATAASITVSQSLAKRYSESFNVRPVVVTNAAIVTDTLPTASPNRRDVIHLVHHGIAARDRRLELMIETMPHLDSRFRLTFMLIEFHAGYLAELRQLAQRIASDRVSFLAPVAPTDIVATLAAYDMGIFILPPSTFNYRAALPNKFLDFVAAGLAVCVNPDTEMGRMTQEFSFGVVTPSCDPRDVAATLNRLTPQDLDQMKSQAHAARQVLNADVEMQKLINLYRGLLGTNTAT